MTLTLPWPPSVNTMWRRVGTRTLLSKKGREYRETVLAACLEQLGAGWRSRIDPDRRLAVTITATPPDHRRRDLDNLLKAPLDALEHAGVYSDDALIDDLRIARCTPSKPGRLEVTITEAA